MSFGVVQSAISSIKNNRNLISKRKALKDVLRGVEHSEPLVFEKKSTPKKLKDISEKLQKERNQIVIKIAILSSLLMIILISVLVYFL